MTTPDQIDRAALENLRDQWRREAERLSTLSVLKSQQLGAGRLLECADAIEAILRAAPTTKMIPRSPTREMLEAAQAAAPEGEDDPMRAWASVWRAMYDAAPAGEQVVSNCDLTDPNNLARQQFMSTTPPAEKPVAIVRQRRRKEGRMNVVDTETHFLDEHCGADLPDGTKLYAHPPAPRGVTDGVMRQAADALRAVQASRDATPALIRLVDPALLALTAALEGESDDAEARFERLLRLVMPMAKGYAASHQVGANQQIIAEAEAELSGEVGDQP